MAKRNTVAAGSKPVGAYTLAWAAGNGIAAKQAARATVGHVGMANGLTPCGAHNSAATAARTNAVYVAYANGKYPKGMAVCTVCAAWAVANTAAIVAAQWLAGATYAAAAQQAAVAA